MNWVNSSLQLAGTLLESVDQHAALTLSTTPGGGGGGDDSGAENDGGEEGEGLLSTIKKGITRAKETAVGGTTKTNEGNGENGGSGAESMDGAVAVATPPRSSGGVGGGGGAQGMSIPTPPGSSSSAKSIVRQTPPHSGNGRVPSSAVNSSPSTGGGGGGGVLTLEALKKENARLKADLRLKDKTLATQQHSLQVYEEEMEALERECKDKLAEIQQQHAQLRMEKDADEKNFVQALELKESQLQALTADYSAVKEAERRLAEEMEILRAEISRAEESKDSLWTNAASASQQSEEIVSSLRVELQEAQHALGNAKREFADTKLKMYERQSQLEKTNAELSTSVATLGRELQKAQELAAASSNTSSSTTTATTMSADTPSGAAYAQLQEEYRKVQQTLMVTKKTLHDETRRSEIQRQEIKNLTEEVTRVKSTLVTTQDQHATQVLSLTKTNAALQDKVAQWEATTSGKTHNSDTRIQTLTNRLMEKQETIDTLRSKITTLDVRLANAQSRSATAEDKLAQIERSGGIVAMDMLEMGSSMVGVGGRSSSSGMRARGGGGGGGSNRITNAISRVAPVLERSTRVVTALDVLDKWLLFLGRVFLSIPLARLALLCYVALIHFWVFVVLSFHTSHLNEEIHDGGAAAGGGGGAAAAKSHGLGAPGLFPDGMQVPPGHASSHVSRSASASSSPASTPRHTRTPPQLPASPLRSHAPPHYSTTSNNDDPDFAFSYVAMSEHTLVAAAHTSSVSLDMDALPSSCASASTSSTTSAVTPAELAWLRRCLPIFVQPQVDVDNGNSLAKVFFRFERDADTGRLDCKLCVVLAGEASYNRVWPTRENCVATLFYRTFNRKTYKRTADINYMEFHNVDLTPNSTTPWGSVFSVDHGGEQRWAQGDKGDVCCWFSLMHHYREDVTYAQWTRDADRPLVYLNTCNHMIGEHDTNKELPKHEWSDYAIQEGDAEDAFHYSVAHVPTKCNLYSLVCFWAARNGGHCADGLVSDCGGRGRQGVPGKSRQSLYIQVATSKAESGSHTELLHGPPKLQE